MINHTKDVLGAKAAYIAFKKKRMTQVDTNKNQRQKRIQCKYMKIPPFGNSEEFKTCASKQSLDSRMDKNQSISSHLCYKS